MSKKVSKRLATAVSIRTVQGYQDAEREVEKTTDVVRRHWLRIVALIRRADERCIPRRSLTAAVRSILHGMTAATEKEMERALTRIGNAAFDSAFDIWAETLPAEYWDLAFEDDPEITLLENVEFNFPERFRPGGQSGGRGSSGKRPASSADAPTSRLRGPRATRQEPAPTPKSEPPKAKKPSPKKVATVKDKTRPSRKGLREIIRSRGWKTRMRKHSKRVTDLDNIAELIADGIEKGDDIDAIINRVKPMVQNFAASARRLVRTEAARIDNALLERTFETFSNIIDGFQIINPLDERTRPHHAFRAGRIYWKDNRRKYKARNRPELPDAPNCRCSYAPVIRGVAPPELAAGPKIDTRTYQKWFANQPESVKRRVVGSRRLAELKRRAKINGRRVSWFDAIDEESGRLIDLDDLRAETPKQTLRRRNRLRRRSDETRRQAENAKRRYRPPVVVVPSPK